MHPVNRSQAGKPCSAWKPAVWRPSPIPGNKADENWGLLSSRHEAKYFDYEEDPMYTKRESEFIQQYLQQHGHLPPGNEEVDDLF